MTFNCLTIFPEMFTSFTGTSLCAKAIEKGLITIHLYDIRDYTKDKHKRVDDYPFGGGAGMLMTPQPLFDCFDAVQKNTKGKKVRTIYLSPGGTVLTQGKANHLQEQYEVLNLLCGHYEGVDQRVLDTYIDEELSIGDYVLTGGELPAMVLMDCVMRYVPEVLSNEDSTKSESFGDGLLEYPQYTRPQEYNGLTVPEVLVSGHHKNIENWQREQSIVKTARVRPDLLDNAQLTEDEKMLICDVKSEK
ncbi:tRNA (guanosine(37)-N1)-methyltransferase TrmD [Christensenellaceae bacterium OttesenSCG-928-K19]|nr:tRNA (guanosine(37)-N1)-methyltransferase TrmD [Christensenellaceae bacterium OttesenSCG-928-K19]